MCFVYENTFQKKPNSCHLTGIYLAHRWLREQACPQHRNLVFVELYHRLYYMPGDSLDICIPKLVLLWIYSMFSYNKRALTEKEPWSLYIIGNHIAPISWNNMSLDMVYPMGRDIAFCDRITMLAMIESTFLGHFGRKIDNMTPSRIMYENLRSKYWHVLSPCNLGHISLSDEAHKTRTTCSADTINIVTGDVHLLYEMLISIVHKIHSQYNQTCRAVQLLS